MKPHNNVAAQNERVTQDIAELTAKFRSETEFFPTALYKFLNSRNVTPSLSVMISASRDEQGINPIVGLLLTQDGRFYDFDLDCDSSGTNVVDINEWTDVTDQQNMCSTNPGTGIGLGYTAMEVQKRLGQPSDTITPDMA